MQLLEVMTRPTAFFENHPDAFTAEQRAEYMATGYTHYRRVSGDPVEMMAILRTASLILADFAKEDEDPLDFMGVLAADLIEDAAAMVRAELDEDRPVVAVADQATSEDEQIDSELIHSRAMAMVEGSLDSTSDGLAILHASALLKAKLALDQPDPLAAAEELLAEHSVATMTYTRDALALSGRQN